MARTGLIGTETQHQVAMVSTCRFSVLLLLLAGWLVVSAVAIRVPETM
jgi:hypothetical protein